ncbi:cell division protein FtsL [Candidatus Ishikawella capsulata]|uniref:Cell division protein FtsL n=1 Tax=Candidatus Ishikawaella capsulata Mpkobe TaxID=476281 RepID=C5WD49_9ENTR|nr:cell division protein FtsL [Candidatus Ishikawaella capsulata]BAH83255.1 membrane bound cell division protein at septum containing leucine zipper motif [Candidatus Ishikawaella capsulata Mpkobe]
MKPHNLPAIIIDDLVNFSKVSLLLLALVLLSAFMVLETTYQTHVLKLKEKTLYLENNRLDMTWRNLILESTFLSESSNIESKAIKELHMQYIDPMTERIVLEEQGKLKLNEPQKHS